MTVKELRYFLYLIKNQEITIRELRSMLFEVADQNKDIKELTLDELTEKYN